MRLAAFIAEQNEEILQEFEDFARTHTESGRDMDIAALRDHASAILHAIALDMAKPQTEAAQKEKSKGDAPSAEGAALTAAEQHGAGRAGSGFSLEEMFAEYRALRASVLRLWIQRCEALDLDDLADLMRFNEAIDQALAESITKFAAGIGESKEMFIAILGHDLRTPLGAVMTASGFLVSEGGLTGANATMASRIQTSAASMNNLIADLLDFTRSRLGQGIPIDLEDTDLDAIIRETIGEINAYHPDAEFEIEVLGDVAGEFDPFRISQALSNLIGNARQHGQAGTPITVTAKGKADVIVISVHNRGKAIAPEDLRVIFDPYKRNNAPKEGQDRGSMGLGLYIAHQIVIAHGGSLNVRSSVEEGTTFEMHLPR